MWVSMPDLRAVLGADMANALCNTLGGVPIYVPQEARVDHDLAKAVGMKGMEALCARYKGEYITVPSGHVQKEQILRMLSEGWTKRKIAQTFGVTERYVYQLAELTPGADTTGQLTLF